MKALPEKALFELRSEVSPDMDYTSTLILDFPAFKIIRNKFVVYKPTRL